MSQFVNSTEEVIYCQIQTGSADQKIVPGEIVESNMQAEYLKTLGLTALETKDAEGEVTKETKAEKAKRLADEAEALKALEAQKLADATKAGEVK